jgi:hypothetical protein
MRVSRWLLVLAVVGCNGGGGSNNEDWVSSDQRIDAAGAGDSVDSETARMCVSENGNVYAVWHDAREGSNDIWFQASLNGGQGWMSAAVQVNRSAGAATNPDVACIGNTVFVVWEDASDGELENKNIYFNRSDSAGTQWLEEDVRLDNDPTGKAMSISPRIASAADEIHVIWSDAVNGAYDIYVASSTNRGSSFGAPLRIDGGNPGAAFSAFPVLVTDGAGTVVAAWEDSRAELNDIYVASSQDSGKTWTEDFRVDGGDEPGSADSFAPRLALGDGVAYVVWHDERNSERDIFMNYSADDGRTWLPAAVQVESDGPGAADSTFPAVAVAGRTAHIVWQDRRHGGFDVFYRSFIDGVARAIEVERDDGSEPSGADAEYRLDRNSGSRPGVANSVNARVAVDAGNVVVAWEDRRYDGYNPDSPSDPEPQGYNDLFYNYSEDDGINWADEDERLDSYPRGQKYAVDLSLDVNDDNVLALWLDGRRGNKDVMFTRIGIGDAGASAPDAIAENE